MVTPPPASAPKGRGRFACGEDAGGGVKSVRIGNRAVGSDQPCFIIAEAGVNHNGRLELAKRLVDAAVEADVDAVKFQTFTAEEVASPFAAKADYQLYTTGGRESQLDMIRRLELSREDHRELKAYCDERGICFLSSPFDAESADFLETLGVPAFKIPSGEITHLGFLAHVARKGRPLIVSTGMSTLEEVKTALHTIQEAADSEVVLLHCVSNYPASPSDVNLKAIRTLASTFKTIVGFSDHTLGIEVALGAVVMGACVVEKHFTLDCTLPGPDHRASLDPGQLTALVKGIRKLEQALGDGCKQPVVSEIGVARVARRSLVAAVDIPKGTVLTAQWVAVKRPGEGLPPATFSQVMGRRVKRDIPAGALLDWEMLK